MVHTTVMNRPPGSIQKAPVHNSLGVYMKLGQRKKAVDQFTEALRLRPDDAAAAENLQFAQSSGGSVPASTVPTQ